MRGMYRKVGTRIFIFSQVVWLPEKMSPSKYDLEYLDKCDKEDLKQKKKTISIRLILQRKKKAKENLKYIKKKVRYDNDHVPSRAKIKG